MDNDYPIKLLDINFLVNTLYNFLYSENKGKLLPDKLDYNNIDIHDIKLHNLSIPLQTHVINNLFNTDIKLLYRKLNKYTFRRNDVIPVDIMITTYNDILEKDSLTSHENANSLITWILSELVIKQYVTGIILNIMCVDLKLSLLKPFLQKFPVTSHFVDMPDDAYVCCTVQEHFFKKQNLEKIRDSLTEEQKKSIIIQVFLIIIGIQKVYPTFRHNNLTCDNIYIYYKDPELKHFINDQTEKLHYNDNGIEVKISGFDKSIITGITDNNGLLSSDREKDIYYDINTFLKNIKFDNFDLFNTHIKNKLSLLNIMEDLFITSDNIISINAEMNGGGKKKKIRGERKIRKMRKIMKGGESSEEDRRDPLDEISDDEEEIFNQGFSTAMVANPEINPMAMNSQYMQPVMPQTSQTILHPLQQPFMQQTGMPMSSALMGGAYVPEDDDSDEWLEDEEDMKGGSKKNKHRKGRVYYGGAQNKVHLTNSDDEIMYSEKKKNFFLKK